MTEGKAVELARRPHRGVDEPRPRGGARKPGAGRAATEGGPRGAKLFPSAQTFLLDDSGKIKVERIVSYAVPR